MDKLFSNIKIIVPEKIYLKDPETSELGKRIITHSILLIDEMGFDDFTFKKLGAKIKSNESSIYRYFESKHKLLLYLSSWYWAWLEYQLVFETHSIADAKKKLETAIEVLTRTVIEDTKFTHINEIVLHRIIINENSKSFLTKQVDQENKDGYFVAYKRIVSRLKDMITAINPNYEYPLSLASNITEGALYQHFLKEHFSSLTNIRKTSSPSQFFIELTLKAIQ